MKRRLTRIEPYRDMETSDATYGRNGRFYLPASMLCRTDGTRSMCVIVSDASGWDAKILGKNRWEHVSASWQDRCPTWSEMCRLKDLIFNPTEVVIQFHPSESEYVNHHPFCLHLWKPIDEQIPTPPSNAVGPVAEAMRTT